MRISIICNIFEFISELINSNLCRIELILQRNAGKFLELAAGRYEEKEVDNARSVSVFTSGLKNPPPL